MKCELFASNLESLDAHFKTLNFFATDFKDSHRLPRHL